MNEHHTSRDGCVLERAGLLDGCEDADHAERERLSTEAIRETDGDGYRRLVLGDHRLKAINEDVVLVRVERSLGR